MESYYIGTDLKFKIDIQCAGFQMQRDDFSITLHQPNKNVTLHKTDLLEDENHDFYLTLNSNDFAPGIIQMIVEVKVADSDFEDGFRNEVTVIDLCKIKRTI